MYYSRYLTYFSLVFLLLLQSCKTTKTVTSDIPSENALLWKIEGKNILSPSYLYGTIHIIGSEDYFLPQGTMTAFDSAKKVLFEIDMAQMSDISAIMGIMNKILMKDDKTLADLISKEDYTLVSNHFSKIGLPIFMLQKMKPMFLTIFAYNDMDPNGLQSGSMKSYEMEFYEMAKVNNKKVGGLETMDFQLDLFDQIPYEDQAKMLVDAIKAGDKGNDEFTKMTEIYKNQDINAMITMMDEDGGLVTTYQDDLLVKRNKSWIPLIINEIKAQPTFFAVGAAHLGGKNGVIALLRKEGIKVTPVKS